MQQSNRILILSGEQPPITGGAGVVAREIYDYLCLRKKVIRINKPVYVKSKFQRYTGTFVFLFFILWNLHRSDIIILNDMYSKKIWIKFFSWVKRKKIILYFHGSEFEYLLNHWAWSAKFLILIKNSFKIISVSEFLRKKLVFQLSQYNETHSLGKIHVIHTGINQKAFRVGHLSQFSPDRINICSVSRQVWSKGYREMLTWIKAQDFIDKLEVHWDIVGDGDDAEEIKNWIQAEGDGLSVKFHGRKNRRELVRIYQESDIFLLLSNFEEAFGLVFVEASACGCWSIGLNKSGVKEAIIDGESGTLLNSLTGSIDIENLPTRQEIRESVKQYDINVTIDKLVAVLGL